MYVLFMVMRICVGLGSALGADQYLAYISERGGFAPQDTVVCLSLEICVLRKYSCRIPLLYICYAVIFVLKQSKFFFFVEKKEVHSFSLLKRRGTRYRYLESLGKACPIEP